MFRIQLNRVSSRDAAISRIAWRTVSAGTWLAALKPDAPVPPPLLDEEDDDADAPEPAGGSEQTHVPSGVPTRTMGVQLIHSLLVVMWA
jgi:hypothetical protein